jgi:xanthine dehydrogenase accessory factor
MHDWRKRLLARMATGPVVMITVVATKGSTPREVGARMLVYRCGQDGSIGGGRLEFQEAAAAEALIALDGTSWQRQVRRIVLGPDAGQCCGGVVEVLHERITHEEACIFAQAGVIERPTVSGVPAQALIGGVLHKQSIWTEQRGEQTWLLERTALQCTPLYLYGAGHVARALVNVLRDLPVAVNWIDIEAARFPKTDDDTRRIVTTDVTVIANNASADAVHIVMTHDHDLDAQICEALLQRGDFSFLGLIGSDTKRARFVQRFRRAGIADAALQRLICPIGHADIRGKAPPVIAISIAAQLIAVFNSAA